MASSNIKFVYDRNVSMPAWDDIKKSYYMRVFQERNQLKESMSDKFSASAENVELWLRFLREYGPVEYRKVNFDLDQLQEKLDGLVDNVLKEAEFIGDDTYGGKMEEFLEGDVLGGNGMNEGMRGDDMPVFVDVNDEEEVESVVDVLQTAKAAVGK
ncbi:hypothetical protein HDU76_009523 [Blyttiomyces sp. JEL0837]|nr:hypothetical protein HDU76_009523 [Blyttiomyces sp. JEL0837]